LAVDTFKIAEMTFNGKKVIGGNTIHAITSCPLTLYITVSCRFRESRPLALV